MTEKSIIEENFEYELKELDFLTELDIEEIKKIAKKEIFDRAIEFR